MSIRFKCPNGHEMNVKDKYAGLVGLCPHCQAQVLVPTPVAKLTEDVIVDLLGPPPTDEESLVHQVPGRAETNNEGSSSTGTSLRGAASPFSRGMKVCPKCHREVRAVYDICPHCRTYFTDLSEVSRRLAYTCPKCGAEYEHHRNLTRCESCGAELGKQR